MGKASRKLMKKQLKVQMEERESQMDTLKEKVRKLVEQEKYAEAINTMAGLAELKCMDPEVMYEGAFCYFMIGDYDRAAKWIDNTLTYAPEHIMARILLARLCILQERTGDALAIFDHVLDQAESLLDEETREEVEEILEYYGRNEPEKLLVHYPHIAAFLGLEETAAPMAEAATTTGKTDAVTKAQEAIAAMQRVMAEAKEQATVQEPVPEAAPVSASAAAVTETQPQEGPTAEAMCAQVMGQQISIREKVRLLNSFAGSYFYEGELAGARKLLSEAVKLDTQDGATLRNMAYLALAEGNAEEALSWASHMPVADFGLLLQLRKH